MHRRGCRDSRFAEERCAGGEIDRHVARVDLRALGDSQYYGVCVEVPYAFVPYLDPEPRNEAA